MTTRATTAITTRATTAATSRRPTPRRDRAPAYGLALLLVAAAALFGGVYIWAAALLAAGLAGLLLWTRPALATTGWPGVLDLSLVALLAGIAIQLVPLPAGLVSVIAPARLSYFHAATLQGDLPALLPLTLDWRATVHAWLATFCAAGTFWAARAIFAWGGVRGVITTLAWAAVVAVLIATAQAAAGTTLVYGFWRPFDAGARPFGPFVNRNHFGTWSLLTFFLCFGCLQWRRSASSPSRDWTWRGRLAHTLDGRGMILVLALVLLALGVAVGASRSTMLALACGAGYVACTTSNGEGARGAAWTTGLGLTALVAMLAYADLDRLVSRVDETRQVGFSQRVAIWRDSLDVISAYPVAGAGAGSFSHAMRLYQTSDRTYFWNEAHSHYLQVAAEGGLLLAIPSGAGLVALAALVIRAVRRRADPRHWLRHGASASLVAVATQSIWETGLSLPANGMLAAVAAAVVVHSSSSGHRARGTHSARLASPRSPNAAARD